MRKTTENILEFLRSDQENRRIMPTRSAPKASSDGMTDAAGSGDSNKNLKSCHILSFLTVFKYT